MFRRYLLVGGLPDAVNTFIETSNIVAVRAVHDEIHELYKGDASQYDDENSLKIQRIYEMIPSNMENKKKRLHYNEIENKKGKRSSDYVAELEYLISSGISLDVLAVSIPKFPLKESGQDFRKHRALDRFVQNEDYHIKRAILFSNDGEVRRDGKVVYMPIYYAMFLKPSTPGSFLIPKLL